VFNRFLLVGLLLASSTSWVTAQSQINHTRERLLLEQSNFVENYEVRQNLRDIISTQQFNAIDISARIHTQEASPNRVRSSIVRMDDFFYIVFANEIFHAETVQSNAASRRQLESAGTTSYDLMLSDRFQMDGRGSYIIKKNILDGSFEHIKVYLQSGSESYILLTPLGANETTLDVYLFDLPVYRNVRLPMSFMTVATVSLARIMATTNHTVDWSLIFASLQTFEPQWNYVQQINRQIRLRLPELVFVADGAQNSTGTFVYASTGESQSADRPGFGSAGFVKWIMDGFYQPLSQNRLMEINNLKESTSRRRLDVGALRDEPNPNNPFFYLDWNRNLAYLVNRSIFPRHRIHMNDSDVNNLPFLAYTPDIGYPLSSLEAAVYLESILHPGTLLLGSINTLSHIAPATRTHHHTLAILPYFDSFGNLQMTLYHNNQEITIEELQERYVGAFIHLQRITTNRNPFVLPATAR
jgi:hypothetical protein